MQKDFHYYCIAVLAKAAGFKSEDALTIAYASQYVDDATESELIRLKVDDGDLKFDPVRTSYYGLDMIHALGWSAQKRIWIPFHFVPPNPFRAETHAAFSFVTEAASPFATLLLQQAAREPLAHRQRRLCRIGIALHSYADTWSHQGFSGRRSRDENDVAALRIYTRRTEKWDALDYENILFNMLPQIGHAEAGFFPDMAFYRWKYTHKSSGKVYEWDNTTMFLNAAHNIYEALVALEKAPADTVIPWPAIAPQIQRLLSRVVKKARVVDRFTLPAYRLYVATDVDRRCTMWQRTFKSLFGTHSDRYAYDKHAWRDQAIEGNTNWDNYSQAEWAQMLPRTPKPRFWNSLWVHFHRAALRHRHLVLENLP